MKNLFLISLFIYFGTFTNQLTAQPTELNERVSLIDFEPNEANSKSNIDTLSDIKFRSNLEFGFAGSRMREDGPLFSILMSNGFQKERNYLGIGTGVEFYDIHIVPIYLDYRFDFLMQKKATPFLYANLGHAFPFGEKENENKVQGGLMYSTGIGIKGLSKKGRNYSISVGYRYQWLRSEFRNNWTPGEIKRSMTYKRFFVKFTWYLN